MRKTGSETSTGQKKCQSVYSDPIHVSFILATKSTKNTKMDLFESPVAPLGNDEIRFFVLFVAKNS